ncbi:MAG: DoxX family protein [Cytophagales bacterium]|nr:MAG: DoxX family protein [Cytophagales bacterium]
MDRTQNIISWVAQVIAAAILAQTLFFKFTAAPESVYIFSTLGIEPIGRIGSGVAELIAVILLLIPRTAWAGSLLGFGIMAGAIFSHLTLLGIEVQGDGGELFNLAVIVLVACGIVVFLKRREIPILKQFLTN